MLSDGERTWLENQVAKIESEVHDLAYKFELIKAKLDGGTVKKLSLGQIIPKPETRNSKPETADLPEGERKILVAVGQHANAVTRQQLMILTGYKRSTRDAYLARLAAKNLVQSNGHGIHLTDLGVDKLGKGFQPLPTGEALREHWLTKLPKGERQIFQILCLAWPKSQSRDFLSEQTGYKRSSRDAYLARLSTRQLVEAVGPGEVKAADTLFEE